MEKVLYSVEEAAELLITTKNRVYTLIHEGHIRAMKLGHLKIPRKEIMTFLDNNIGKDLTDLSNIKELVFEN